MFEQANLGERRGKFSDWLVRAGIAALFILFGAQKFPSDPASEWFKIFQQIGFGAWFRYFTGLVEVVGGLLVLIPQTVTTGLALLACTMLGAVLIDAFVLRSPLFCMFPFAFLIGLVAFGLSRS